MANKGASGFKSPHKTVRLGANQGKKVNKTELAVLWGTSLPTINRYISLGMPAEQDGRSYVLDTAECLNWRLQKEKDDNQTSAPSSEMTIEEARRRLEVARAMQAEVALQKELGALIVIDEIMEQVEKALSNVRASAVSLSNRISGRCEFQDQKTIRNIIDQEVNEMLEALSGFESGEDED
ncbi:hypothetical protein A134_23080 [Vibrio crassostreae 9CS106]|uniref:Terminase n=1 Tax=Vibrio crassostreae 9CS106 TaxID=1191300 RepID=A0A1B1C3B3_9VIBR|nr:hypothetical protein A134_23080 [Vibrio crassostreae 9CS106]